jgi:hypothetical protein
MLVKFDLQHFCCGPKGCEIEVEYGEMMDARIKQNKKRFKKLFILNIFPFFFRFSYFYKIYFYWFKK